MVLSCLIRFDPTLSWDGLFTLLGGALVLVGVWWQIRDVHGRDQKQLSREEEQRKGVAKLTATALLVEIDWTSQKNICVSLSGKQPFSTWVHRKCRNAPTSIEY
jgi:hypothetical protein